MAALGCITTSSMALVVGFGGTQFAGLRVRSQDGENQRAEENCCDAGGAPGQLALDRGLTHPVGGELSGWE